MANHLDLRAFQQNLSNQMEAGGAVQQITTLGLSIAGQNWLVEMSDIGEVLPAQVLMPVPMAKSWVKGVTNVRGNLYCVADLAEFFKLGKASGNSDNRLLFVAGRYAFNAALVVDKVLGLRDVRAWRKEGSQYRDEHDVVWHKLDVENLLSQSEFLQIGA